MGHSILARRVHQSGHSMTELEEACLRLKTECLKLSLICPTRWNCYQKMITAVQRTKEPLLYLKRHNSDFEKLVPTEDEFEYFKSLSNMLKQVKDCSDFLSNEKSVRFEEDVSATSQNLLQEILTPGTTRKRHPTPDPSNIFSSLQQKFQRTTEAKHQQFQQNQVRPLRCELKKNKIFLFFTAVEKYSLSSIQ